MRTKIWASALVTAAATAALVAPTAAQADTGAGGTGESVLANRLSLGQDTFLGGRVWQHQSSATGLGAANDQASSAKNDDTRAWILYEDAGYEGIRYCIRPGEFVRNMHVVKWKFGDTVSSVRRMPTASCGGQPPFYP